MDHESEKSSSPGPMSHVLVCFSATFIHREHANVPESLLLAIKVAVKWKRQHDRDGGVRSRKSQFER